MAARLRISIPAKHSAQVQWQNLLRSCAVNTRVTRRVYLSLIDVRKLFHPKTARFPCISSVSDAIVVDT